MSWSANMVGKPKAVAAKLARELSWFKCEEPEESIKNAVSAALAAALAAFPPDLPVSIVANGSQQVTDVNKPAELQNYLYVELKPLYGFIE